MQKAYEWKEEFNREGKCLRREWSVGAIVPWSVVSLVALIKHQAILSVPAAIWQLFKR